MTSEESNTSCDCALKILSFLSNNHSVHPLEPAAPKHSEFVQLDSRIKIRVIHVKPKESHRDPKEFVWKKRFSLSEEYWFTRWNRPLKNCNCSFRRSLRFSNSSEKISDISPTKIINVETFVERLIQETLFEAFQEYFAKRGKHGIINEAYSTTEVERLSPPILEIECITVPNQSSQVQNICDHVKTVGRSKPLVMLLHGIGCSADIWWTIIDGITQHGYEVIAPDLLGHGFSSAPKRPSSYTFQNLLRVTAAVFEHYAYESRKVILIGHSFGCSLATAMYKSRAQQVVQLILISGGGPTPLAPPAEDPSGLIEMVMKPLLMCGLKRSLFYTSRGKHLGSCDVDKAIPKHVLNSIEKGQSWPEGDAAYHRKILVPTLLVHGLQDKQVTLVQECEMERTIPRAFLELIPNAGHLAMLDTPEHLRHMLLCFMDWWSQ